MYRVLSCRRIDVASSHRCCCVFASSLRRRHRVVAASLSSSKQSEELRKNELIVHHGRAIIFELDDSALNDSILRINSFSVEVIAGFLHDDTPKIPRPEKLRDFRTPRLRKSHGPKNPAIFGL